MQGHAIRVEERLGGKLPITKDTQIVGGNPIIEYLVAGCRLAADRGQPYYRQITCHVNVELSVMNGLMKRFSFPAPVGTEWHIVLAERDEIQVYSASERGLLYGIISLIQKAENSFLDRCFLYCEPACEERGVKVFIPAEQDIPFFRQFIDSLLFYKFNTIMIEIGGAMEYERHPEINRGWIEYCKEMSEYSGKTKRIQEHIFPWYKNAIHIENAGGRFLSKEKLKELVEYCKQRQLNVIPEVPTLSHCDYLMLGNREIAERSNDPYPDTYCPSNPDSYRIVFDVIDEVLEVFQPSVMNIGHDEYYSMCVCDKCRKKKAQELFADDVNKIADYLSARQVKTMIWGDKLLKNAAVDGAGPFGGAEIRMTLPSFAQNGKYVGVIPPTYQAIDLIRRDVQILHWCWPLGKELENEIFEAGFDLRFGNFDSYLFADWLDHLSKGSKGAIISNWSSLNETILQRNGIFFNIAYASEMFWNPDFSEVDFPRFRKEAFTSLYQMKNKNRARLVKTEKARGVSHLEIVWTTDVKIPFEWFVDGVFPEKEKYEIADLILSYTDGSEEKIPVIYGENIGNTEVSWGRTKSKNGAAYVVDDHLYETTYQTCPEMDQENARTWYRYLFDNPHADKCLNGLSVYMKEGKNGNVYIREYHKLAEFDKEERKNDE